MQNDYLIYKIKFGQQVVAAAHALIIPALILFLMAGLGFERPIVFLSLVIVCFILFWAPILPIHINYLKEDNDKIVKINYEERIIVIQQYGQKKKVQFEDIQHIIINANHTGRYSPWLNYKYAAFKLQDGSYFVITRLIMNFDEEIYTLLGTKSKDHWYPIIKEEGEN
jgi:hypothetical protein